MFGLFGRQHYNTVSLTHGDVGQFVRRSVGVDAVEVRACDIDSPQHQGSTDVPLVPTSNGHM